MDEQQPDYWRYLINENPLNGNRSPLPRIKRTLKNPDKAAIYTLPTLPTNEPTTNNVPIVPGGTRPCTRISSPYTDLFGPRESARTSPARGLLSPAAVNSPEMYDSLWKVSWRNHTFSIHQIKSVNSLPSISDPQHYGRLNHIGVHLHP